jgi:hypothetical protein
VGSVDGYPEIGEERIEEDRTREKKRRKIRENRRG